MLQRFTSGIGNVKTRKKFIRKEPRSMEEALRTARAYAAAANATGSSLDSTFGAMAISVAESKAAYNVSDNHRQFSNCIYCQRFGSAAQRCGHNPPLRFPGSRGYWPPSRQTNQGFTAAREVRPYHRELRTANGTVLQTKGSSRTNVTIGNKTVSQEVCVSDAIPWDGIIGLDILVKAGCTIDGGC
ncbi:hypothetical protein EG68_03156 [Paragonimus skrjabini miyazakii]|uniref:Uncharacterized protein n=1 Tax=Paragonimus skrjabini miyazakii TaxID=59628 RepID=A0A8S9Z6H4_9TREM|nr:hypothetical protein EG68_03156 [Paragonimus skrjabini miyazakii]